MGGNSLHQRVDLDRVLCWTFVALALGLRVAAARGDLWFDELWSLSFARELDAPWEVLTRIHHDNNHPLNTLALYVTLKRAGTHARPLVYRALSLLCGVATIPVLLWMPIGDSDAPSRSRLFKAVLGALSFLAVVYSSEARGYAPAAFFALTAFGIVRGSRLEFTRNRRLALAVACVLGILSHLTFVFVYAGLVAWTFARVVRSENVRWRSWMALHMLPVSFLVGDYVLDLRKLSYGGGPPFHVGEVVVRTLSLAANGPGAGGGRNIAAVVTAAIVVGGIAELYMRRSDEWIFFATSLVLAPASVLLLYRARYLDPRYFFVLMPFFWLLLARALSMLWSGGGRGRLVAAPLLALFVGGSIAHLVPFLRYQRGDYSSAVDMMARLNTAAFITVGSDHDVRNRMVLEYYGEVLPSACMLRYVPIGTSNRDGPEWYVTHRFDEVGPISNPPASITVDSAKYHLVRSFPYGGISGWTWHLYRNTDALTSSALEPHCAPPAR